jgi:hypothetical protein
MSDLDTRVLAPEIVDAEPVIVEFPEFRLPIWEKKEGAFQRRLARAGLPAPAIKLERFDKKVLKGGIELDDGTIFGASEVIEPWIRVELEEIRIVAGHYTFVAALVGEEAGYTVHCAPGQSLDGWERPAVDDIHCDHCNLKRDRKRLYIIRDDRDDSLIQVGHTCIEAFTGLAIKGLWALTYGAELRGVGGDDDSGGGQRFYGAPVDRVLGLAFAFANEGKAYVSRKAAEFSPNWATADEVRTALFGRIQPPQRKHFRLDRDYERELERYHRFLDNIVKGDGFSKDSALIAEIRKAADSLKAGTDYADNMHTILAGENVSGRNVGILASLVAVYAREKELAVKRSSEPKAPLAKGILAPVKTRIRDLEITITSVGQSESEWGWSTRVVGRTPDHHLILWWAKGRIDDWEAGDVLVLDAKVKGLKPFTGRDGETIDQTVIYYAKVIEHRPAEDAVC